MLPKELTTVTPLSKGLALAMFIFIPFITFILGVNSQKINTETSSPQDVTIKSLQKENAELQLDLQLASDNRGRFVDSKNETYTFETFGLASPLFNNKEIMINTYKYKTATVTSKKIVTESTDDSSAGVTVWESSNANYSAIFEDHTSDSLYATPIDSLMQQWKEIYKGPHDQWHWRYATDVKSNMLAIYLETRRSFGSQPGDILISIFYNNSIPTNNPLQINSMKEKLKQIADTIPYHI
jgi:hypothetical protein